MLSVILPTFNEAKNIEAVILSVDRALSSAPYEIIVVDDDSPDMTWNVAEHLHRRFSQVRVLRRMGRRGLSSAVLEGFAIARGETFLVMDADGQHDSMLIPALLSALEAGADIAIGSRYIAGGSVGDWDERRHTLSRFATFLALTLCRVRVRDPMSGFFAVRRSVYEETLPRLNPKGFKILLDFLVHLRRDRRIAEVPLRFQPRAFGESKFSALVQFQFLEYLYDVTLGRYFSSFRLFCLLHIILSLLLSVRVWDIKPLFFDPSVRNAAQSALHLVAAQSGWSLSSLVLTDVTQETARIIVRPHGRTSLPSACFVVRFSSHFLLPCVDS